MKSFNFTSDGVKRSSAGIYKQDGTLVKMLWSNQIFPSGSHTADWDETDDFGDSVPFSTYIARVLHNNVTYEWEGVIGNNSTENTGASVWRGYGLANGLCITGTTAYVAQGFGEFFNVEYKFDLSDPHTKIPIYPTHEGIQTALACCTDGTNVYWAEEVHTMQEPELEVGNRKLAWHVFATKVSDDTEVDFASGVSYTSFGRTHPKVIAVSDPLLSGNANRISSLAVGATYLFVSTKNVNKVAVYNKTTGALAQTLTFTKPTGLAIDGSSLWIVSNDTVVSKYTINSNGTLTSATVTLSGLSQPQGIAVNGSIVAVCDVGTSQQVKAYNTTTGASLWTLGTEGGFISNSQVDNNKFFFSDINGVDYFYYSIPSIAFQSDGSFWVADSGNRRIQHYDSSRNFINNLMFLEPTYQTCMVGNDSTRLIEGTKEFSINYSQPLDSCWTLTNNYGYNFNASTHEGSGSKFAQFLSNGRTYALYSKPGYLNEIVELSSTGTRFTGITIAGGSILTEAGDILHYSERVEGEPTTVTIQTLTGFDGSNNPTYASETTYIQTPDIDPDIDPVSYHSQQEAITNGLFIFFDDVPKTPAGGYHLGAIKIGTSEWKWRTAKGTGSAYSGPFPDDGRFDDGNDVNDYAGSQAVTAGNHVVYGYHGEFWQNAQTNKFNHFFYNGLFIGQFGKTGRDEGVLGVEAPPEYAGNALTPDMVIGTDGNIYLYHGDESHHSGVHRWKMNGLDTIVEEIIYVSELATEPENDFIIIHVRAFII